MPELLSFDQQYPEEAKAFDYIRRNTRDSRIARTAAEFRAKQEIDNPKTFTEALEDAHKTTMELMATALSNDIFEGSKIEVPEIDDFSDRMTALKHAYDFLAKNSALPKIILHPNLSPQDWIKLINNFPKANFSLSTDLPTAGDHGNFNYWQVTAISSLVEPLFNRVDSSFSCGLNAGKVRQFINNFACEISGSSLINMDYAVTQVVPNISQNLALFWINHAKMLPPLDQARTFIQAEDRIMWAMGQENQNFKVDLSINEESENLGFRPCFSINRNKRFRPTADLAQEDNYMPLKQLITQIATSHSDDYGYKPQK